MQYPSDGTIWTINGPYGESLEGSYPENLRPTAGRQSFHIDRSVLFLRGDRLRRRHPTEWIRERNGVYHLAGDGYASRLEWARSILELDPHPDQQVYKVLKPAKTSDFISPAERPLFSALNCDKFADTFQFRLPDWKVALELAMAVG